MTVFPDADDPAGPVDPAGDRADDAVPRRGRRPRWWRRFQLLPRTLRVTSYVALGVVLVLVAASIAGVVVVRRTFPQTTGTIHVPGLGARVEVLRDAQGVPQIYASTTEDLMYAEGYVHAQERFFQMDVRRHATAGRLAELFGAKAVGSDVYVRTLGWRRVAERELPMLDPSTRIALDAYSNGVNAYLDSHSTSQISLEYSLLKVGGLDYTPEPWTDVDSLAWLKAMAWDLRGTMQDEVARVESQQAVGAARARQLFPAYPYGENTPIVDQGAMVDDVYEPNAKKENTRIPKRPAPFGATSRAARSAVVRAGRGLATVPAWLGSGDGIGSNAFAVDGSMTASGKPLLADDPHLGVSQPGVWMQVGLHCTTISDDCPYDVSGFSFSGVPGVIVGHNADVAWGFANLAPDVTDLYVERVVGDDWRYDGQLRPLRTREEVIKVEGGDDVHITVRSTKHGPIVSDADAELRAVADDAPVPRPAATAGQDEYAVSLSWTALTPRPTADAFLALDRAHDWDSFRAAASSLAAPGQSIVYADTAGHVGYQASGLIPIRKSGNSGVLPSAGWRPEDDWSGDYVPFDALPNVLDPKDHLVVAANNAVIDPQRSDYPYYLGDDWDHGYRSQRIRTLLSGRTGLTASDLSAVQLDDLDPMAASLLPLLADVREPRGYYSAGPRLLAAWDGHQGADSAAAAFFAATWRNLLAITFHDELPTELWPDGGQRWMAVVTQLLRQPDSPWWDDVTTDDVQETRDDDLRQAMKDARDELTRRIGPSPDDWTWGALHQLRLTADDSPAPRLFDRGGYATGGGSAAVDATAWDAADGYDVTTAPSMRMVVDLADLDSSRWVDLTGVSGHAFDSHYNDQTQRWLAGQTLAWPSSSDAVHAAAEDTLTLEPDPAPTQ